MAQLSVASEPISSSAYGACSEPGQMGDRAAVMEPGSDAGNSTETAEPGRRGGYGGRALPTRCALRGILIQPRGASWEIEVVRRHAARGYRPLIHVVLKPSPTATRRPYRRHVTSAKSRRALAKRIELAGPQAVIEILAGASIWPSGLLDHRRWAAVSLIAGIALG